MRRQRDYANQKPPVSGSSARPCRTTGGENFPSDSIRRFVFDSVVRKQNVTSTGRIVRRTRTPPDLQISTGRIGRRHVALVYPLLFPGNLSAAIFPKILKITPLGYRPYTQSPIDRECLYETRGWEGGGYLFFFEK